MNIPRIYVGEAANRAVQHFGAERCWLQDTNVRQSLRSQGIDVGNPVVLFNEEIDILYKIIENEDHEITLHKETEIQKTKPKLNMLVAWGAQPKQATDILITELVCAGVRHFVPLLAQNSNHDHPDEQEILPVIIKALETSQYSNLPQFESPISPEDCISTFNNKYQFKEVAANYDADEYYAMLLPPLGGWSEPELKMFRNVGCYYLETPEQINDSIIQLRELLQ